MSSDHDLAGRLLTSSVTVFRSISASMAVLHSWCHSLGSRGVRIVFDNMEQLRTAHALLTGPTPFAWPEHDITSLVIGLMHSKLDRTLVMTGKDRLFSGTKLEVCFAVRLANEEEIYVLVPLAYRSSDDKEQQVCQNMGCGRAQPAVQLKFCSRCHGAKYCSRDCQLADWRHVREGSLGHRDHCKRLAAGGAWHPKEPGVIPPAIADRYPHVF